MVRLSKPSTSEERAVLVWAAVILLALMGGVACYYSQRAMDLAKPDAAQALWRIAQASFGLAGLIALGRVVWVRLAA